MKKLEKVAMAAFIILLSINVGIAQPKQGNGPQIRNNHEYMMEGLNLAEDQQLAVKNLHLQMQKEALPIKNKLGENRAKLQTLSTEDEVDMKAINKLIDANSELEASLEKKAAATKQAVRKLLTDDQRIIFDSHIFNQGRQMRGQEDQRQMRFRQPQTPGSPYGSGEGRPGKGY